MHEFTEIGNSRFDRTNSSYILNIMMFFRTTIYEPPRSSPSPHKLTYTTCFLKMKNDTPILIGPFMPALYHATAQLLSFLPWL